MIRPPTQNIRQVIMIPVCTCDAAKAGEATALHSRTYISTRVTLDALATLHTQPGRGSSHCTLPGGLALVEQGGARCPLGTAATARFITGRWFFSVAPAGYYTTRLT